MMCRDGDMVYEAQLIEELYAVFSKNIEIIRYGDILYIPQADRSDFVPYWAQVVLQKPLKIDYTSISDAAKQLRSIQRNWARYAYTHFRRSQLIEDSLPYINKKPRQFPFTVPNSPIGMWTLIDDKTIFASAQTNSFFPCGNVSLIEDHENPPSRAYLKLQEALIRCGTLPQKGECCLDAGACPGGWTYVLTQLGAHVTAVDRTELAPHLMSNALVEFIKHDAFTLTPETLGSFDWVFSDVICYPKRLLEWVHMWLAHTKHMICTIKMQGDIDWDTISQFAAIPNSCIVHLSYNKHELTWIWNSVL